MKLSIPTPRGTVAIRSPREEDVPAYRALRLQALHDHPEAFSSDYAVNLARPLTYWADRLDPKITDKTVMIYFADHDRQLVGMCGVAREDSPKIQHNASIISMYVQPDWRGLHIGAGLITACLDWARARGANIARLTVVSTNSAAIRCYTRCGFRVYGVEPQALYHGGVYYDELLMARTI